MAKTTVYLVNGTEEVTTVKEVGAILGHKVTKKGIEAGEYPMVSILDADAQLDLEHKDEFAKQEASEEQASMLEELEEPVADEVDANELARQNSLAKVEEAIGNAPEEGNLFDRLCELEDALNDKAELTEEQATLLTQVLTNTLTQEDDSEDTVLTDTHEDSTDEDDTQDDDTEYPEVGEFKDEKAMKKFIKNLSDKSLEEWCILEGAEWKRNDHESINRMRMAMAIKAIHFPDTAPKKGKKSKSKYAQYETEQLVQMALDNDVEVPDDKGDQRILRMYTIMALRKAGVIE